MQSNYCMRLRADLSLRLLQKVADKLCTTSNHPSLIAAFENDRLGLCSNVRQLPDGGGYEVSVIDVFSGDVVVSRNFKDKALALQIAESLVDIGGQITQE